VQGSGYLLIVVTNQAGIARGYYSEEQFQALTDWMMAQFREQGVEIARVYYCPFHPVHGIGSYKYDSPDRKPNPGMLLRAQADLNLDLASSILIGDNETDIQAARAAGVGTKVLFRSSSLNCEELDDVFVYRSLEEIRERLFLQKGPQPLT
jgi:D-glycero-D-manno-heptose 1,7-bisphosphate phosphatase